MTPALVISFHGGKSGINTLESFPALTNILPGAPSMDELRGFVLGPGSDSSHLYVVNAHKTSSAIFRFTSAGNGTYTAGAVFASDSSLSHPFDAIFGPNDNLYVSNQDSNRITIYQGPTGSSPGAPIGSFGPVFETLRGIAWDGQYFYAADEEEGVIVLDSGGQQYLTVAVDDPVHLFYDGARYVYIGDGTGNSVWVWDTTQAISPNPTQIVGSQSPAIDATGGIALPGDGNLYVASRKGNAILQYPINLSCNPPEISKGTTLSPKLKDNPEFVGALGMGVYG
jgi:hypothetical protein